MLFRRGRYHIKTTFITFIFIVWMLKESVILLMLYHSYFVLCWTLIDLFPICMNWWYGSRISFTSIFWFVEETLDSKKYFITNFIISLLHDWFFCFILVLPMFYNFISVCMEEFEEQLVWTKCFCTRKGFITIK